MAPDSQSALEVTFWGVRGSIPSPGQQTVRYGGNTACLHVQTGDGYSCIFDAGTGIRALGGRLVKKGPISADLFLTHFHWDHIQGLPFFSPLYAPGSALRIHGPRQDEVGVRELLIAQMSGTHFPVPFEFMRASIEFGDLTGGPVHANGARIDSFAAWHPGTTFGYRIQSGGAALAYLPDNEIGRASDPEYQRLVGWLEGVDLLVHDAMYTAAECEDRDGWGHSSFEQAIRLAEDAGVGRLCFFHHEPDRSDEDLETIVSACSDQLRKGGSMLELSVATEGETHVLKGDQE